MSRPLRVPWLVLGAALFALGCDESYRAFLDAVPEAPADEGTPVQVFLGIDGMSRQAFDLARSRGAFTAWNVAELVTPFPGTSDYSWTRTLRAGALGGYEIEYYDPVANQLVGQGLAGVAEHPLREGIADTFDCYRRFDFLGDGETWQARSYLDPIGAFRTTLDALFNTVAGRARTKRAIVAYIMTADVVSHMENVDQAAWVLVELDRRIREFKASQRQQFSFVLFADHGNAHIASELVQPRDVLREVGVEPVDALSTDGEALQAVPVVHVRVNYVALHTLASRAAEIAERSSGSARVDLAVAPLAAADQAGARRFGIWRRGERFVFARAAGGAITVEDPDRWSWLGVDLDPFVSADRATAQLEDRQAFALTLPGPYPDLFYRVATAFSHPAARYPANVLWSMPDDVASIGFEVPFAGEIRANAGFHGSLSRASTMSVVASEADGLPLAVRSDDLADLFPVLGGAGP
jgi:hypothetical protein